MQHLLTNKTTAIKKQDNMEKVICTTCETENPVHNKYCSNCGYELPKIKTADPVQTVEHPTTKKTFRGKKIAGIAIFAVAFALSYFAVQSLFVKEPLYDKAMMKIAGEINKSCPMMIDADTRLDNAVALPGNVFQYNYTLIHLEKATADPEEMRNLLGPTIINYVKTNPQMKPQRDLKTTINYYYKDRAGLFLLMISVTPDKYE